MNVKPPTTTTHLGSRREANPNITYMEDQFMDAEERTTSLALFIESVTGTYYETEPTTVFKRFPAKGKGPNNTSCSVITDETQSWACIKDWSTDETFYWFANNLTPDPRDVYRERTPREDHAQSERHRNAAIKAMKFYGALDPAPASHPYLIKKGIKPHNARLDGHDLVNALEDVDGNIYNVQSIAENGRKYFAKGGRVKGLFIRLGDFKSADTVIACEGWATGATIHERTGLPVAVALSTGNLLHVCTALLEHRHSPNDIIIAADNDHRTKGNPGIRYAMEAAQELGLITTYLNFPCSRGDACRCTDFNDCANCEMGGGQWDSDC
jgi:putative DNA primase/helicase